VKRLAILLACLPAFAQEPAPLFDQAKASVGARLKDPYSAVYESLRLGRAASGAPVVCGTVNAKNSYGAFAGRKRFYWVDDKAFDIEGESGSFALLFEAFCRRQ
jgi:hypothetical protein